MTTWLIISAVLLLAEILTLHLVFASFSLGALAAALTAASTSSVAAQGIVLMVVSALSLLLLRPAVLKRLYKSETTTGMDKLIGQEAVVLETVTSHEGSIRLNGELWTARSQSGPINPDENVIVHSIDGATAIVVKQ